MVWVYLCIVKTMNLSLNLRLPHGSSFFYKFYLSTPSRMQIVLLHSFFILESCPNLSSVLFFNKYILTTAHLVTLLCNNPTTISVQLVDLDETCFFFFLKHVVFNMCIFSFLIMFICNLSERMSWSAIWNIYMIIFWFKVVLMKDFMGRTIIHILKWSYCLLCPGLDWTVSND